MKKIDDITQGIFTLPFFESDSKGWKGARRAVFAVALFALVAAYVYTSTEIIR